MGFFPYENVCLQCWAKEPTQRPSFHDVFEKALGIVLPRLKVMETFEEEGRMKASTGDIIIVIEGRCVVFLLLTGDFSS